LCGQYRPSCGRAAFLVHLREQIADELCGNPGARPPGLSKRCMDWYALAVVPMLVALLSDRPSTQVVDMLGDDGLVEERLAMVSSTRLQLTQVPAVSSAVSEWLRICREHELALLECMHVPSLDRVKYALDLDPVVPPGRGSAIANIIWDSYRRGTAGDSLN